MFNKSIGIKSYTYALKALKDIKFLIPAIPTKLLYDRYLEEIDNIAEPLSYVDFLNYLQKIFNVGLEETNGKTYFTTGGFLNDKL